MSFILVLAACVTEQPIAGTQPAPPPTTAPPTVVEDRIPQTSNAAADLLVVLDPDWFDDAAQGLPGMLDYALGSDVDWQLGFVSTGLGAGAPSPVSDIASLTDPGGPYGGVDAIHLALEDGTFRRPGVPLRILIVASADDAGSSLTAAELAASLEGPDPVTVWSHVPADATAYLDLAAALGGTSSEVGADPLDGTMAAFGLDATGLITAFPLSRPADEASLEVEVDDGGAVLTFEQGTDFLFDEGSNSLAFTEYVPGPSAIVVARYIERP